MSDLVPDGWCKSTLGGLVDARSSNVDKKTVEGERSVYLCNYTDVYYNSRISRKIPFMLASAKDREIERFTLQFDDVIITKDSETPDDIAVPTYISENLDGVLCGYHLTLLRPNQKKSCGEYLAHLFQLSSVRHHFYLLASGITRFGLTADAIANAPLIVPPLPEQQKIAAILTSVDEVIEKTQAQIDKLKDLKTGLMQELLTKGIGIDGKPHTEFKDSPVGRIPKGWEVKALVHICSSKYAIVDGPFGSNLKTEHYRPTGIPVFQSGFVTSNKFVKKKYVFVDQRKYEEQIRSSAGPNDILMAKIGMNAGACAIIPTDHPVGILAGNSLKITVDENIVLNDFVLALLHFMQDTGDIRRLLTETAQPAISITTLKKMYLPIPTVPEQQAIVDALKAIDLKMDLIVQKNLIQQNTKKALMQDLLTGKVRVNVEEGL